MREDLSHRCSSTCKVYVGVWVCVLCMSVCGCVGVCIVYDGRMTHRHNIVCVYCV